MGLSDLNSTLIAYGICESEEIKGCSEGEIAKLEESSGVRLPTKYKDFLKKIGNGAGGVFRGTDIFLSAIVGLNEEAAALLKENGEDFSLPIDAFVFLMHQGYEFSYFCASEGENPPVYQYVEGGGPPVLTWQSFTDFLMDAIKSHAGSLRN